jgi:hypothetical protein
MMITPTRTHFSSNVLPPAGAATRRAGLAGLFALTLLAPAVFLSAGCGGKHGTTVQNDEGEPAAKSTLLSSFRMNDAAAPSQLIKGVSTLEAGAWRWTAGKFSILLKTPPGAAQKGGALSLSFTVSGAVLKQVHTQTLTASIGDKVLGSGTYTTDGGQTLAVDVPAAALTGDTVTVDFSLDNSLPAGTADRRELGVIVTAVALESK